MDKYELDYLFTKLMHGDEEAFEKIYLETKKGLFSFIYSICKNYATAEELMQDTYIRVRAAINTYKPGSNGLAWLFTIAKNLTLNELNKQKRMIPTDIEDPTFKAPEQYITSEDDMDKDDDDSIIQLANRVLNDSERQIVMLQVVSGMKHREIADMMGKPLGTVLWAYRNALKKLKDAYEKEGGQG